MESALPGSSFWTARFDLISPMDHLASSTGCPKPSSAKSYHPPIVSKKCWSISDLFAFSTPCENHFTGYSNNVLLLQMVGGVTTARGSWSGVQTSPALYWETVLCFRISRRWASICVLSIPGFKLKSVEASLRGTIL